MSEQTYAQKLRASAHVEVSAKDENKTKVKFEKESLMTPFKDHGFSEEDIKNYGKAMSEVARGTFGAMTEILTENIKTAVKNDQDWRGLSVSGTGRINRDLAFDGTVRAFKEGKVGEKPYQTFGGGSVSVVVSGGKGGPNAEEAIENIKSAVKKSKFYTPLDQ